MTTHDKEPNHYKDAMKDPDRDAWKAACDLEMKKLRERNCWSVVKRADIPKGTRVMGSRWTFKHKRDETGALCKVSPQPICSQRLHTNQKRTLFRKLRTSRFFRHSPPGLRLNRSDTLSRQSLRGVSRLHRKRTRRRHSTHILQMRRRLRRPREYVYLLHKSLYGMIQSPRAWYQLWCTLCQSFGLQKLVTDGCVHVKYMNNKKSTNQQPNVNLNDLAKHLTPLPIHDRVYADCPHATAILIVVTYVDDNLVFTNCATLRQTFAAHCNKRVRFNHEGPARWYLGTQYDRDPITGAVKASQEFYINKLLARWHMSDCNPTKIPCSGKLDEVLTPLQPKSHPAARLQGAHRQPTFPPDRHDPRDQPDRICPRTIHDHRRRASHGRCEESPAISTISQWCALDNSPVGSSQTVTWTQVPS